MTLGVIVGKFYPFHRGHDLLIREAKRQVDHLVVLVGFKPDQEVPGDIRVGWIKEMHEDVEVLPVLDDLPEAPEPWAERTLEVIAPREVDVVFTSEDYGDRYAALMNAKHIDVDKPRATFPISGTALRADLDQHFSMLTPPAMAYFAKRICITGTESSGTTTLAQTLAQHFSTVWVPEYGRYYWEGRRHTSLQWESYEFTQIARNQVRWEEDLARRANRLVVCDTDPLTTNAWHRRYLGSYSPAVDAIAAKQNYDLYFVTEPDFGWVQDGTRESETVRLELQEWLIELLEEKGRPYLFIGGSPEERMERAVAEVKRSLSFTQLADP